MALARTESARVFFSTLHCSSFSQSEKMTDRFVIAYTKAPACYPKRIMPLKRDWNEEELSYNPPSWTHDVVFKNAEDLASGNQWADVEKPSPTIIGKRRSFSGGTDCPVSEVAKYDSKRARYLFPGGRTGLSGRGLLGRWGPNHAADPIVTDSLQQRKAASRSRAAQRWLRRTRVPRGHG
jgi:hypothetical protein